jgi:predicted nucleic acid-binding protein
LIAFFDTNIYIDLFRGKIKTKDLSAYQGYLIRLSPIVKSELLRGCKTKRARKVTQSLIDQVTELPVPTNKMWEQAALILSTLPETKHKKIDELQNDVLLALTARHTGAIFITQDKDFTIIQRFIPFKWVLHANSRQ